MRSGISAIGGYATFCAKVGSPSVGFAHRARMGPKGGHWLLRWVREPSGGQHSGKLPKRWGSGPCGKDYARFWKSRQGKKAKPIPRGNKLVYPAVAGVVHTKTGYKRAEYNGPAISYRVTEPMSPKTCYILCLPHETIHFALKGSVCVCFDRARIVPEGESKCFRRCKGGSGKCGGAVAMSVYTSSDFVPPTKLPGGVRNRAAFRRLKRKLALRRKKRRGAKVR